MNKVKRTRVEKRNRTCTSQDGMALDEMDNAMPPEELKNGMKRIQKEGLNRVVEKINNEKNKLVVELWKTTQNHEVITDHKWK